MELRSTNHLHFFKTARGGLVTQVLNVHRGRPSLVFKRIQDIYENAKKVNSYPSLGQKDEVDSSTMDSNSVQIKNHCLPVVHRRTIACTPESCVLDCSSGDDRGDSDVEDLGFSNMTLKQIKDGCKGKKRNRPTNYESVEETLEQDYCKPEAKEDDHDLTTPLSCWKSKLSKKAKRKCMKSCPPIVSKGVLSIVKSEEYYEDFQDHNGNMPAHSDEVAVSTSGYLDGQETVCIAVDSSSCYNSSYEVQAPKLDMIDTQSMICVDCDSSAGCNEEAGSSVEIPKSDSSDTQIVIRDMDDSLVGCNENVGCSALEILESDCSDAQTTTHVSHDSSFGCNQNAPCVVEVIESNCPDATAIDSSSFCNENEGSFEVEAPELDCSDAENMSRGASLSEVIESNCPDATTIDSSSFCNENEGSFEVEAPELDCSDAENMSRAPSLSSFRYKDMGSDGVIFGTALSATSECVQEAEVSLSSTEEAQGYLLNEDCVHMEPVDSNSLPPERSLGSEILWKHNPESINHQYSELPGQPQNEGYITLQILKNHSSDKISPINNCSDMCDNSQSYSSTTVMTWQTDSKLDIASSNSLQNMDSSNGCSQHISYKDTEDGLLSTVETNATSISLSNSTLSSDHDPCSRSEICPASVGTDLPIAEEKQSKRLDSCSDSTTNDLPRQPLLHRVADAARYSSQVNPSAITDDFEALPGDRNCEIMQVQRAPKRLFSARKSISPISRKRLCKALESDECCHEEHYKCDGELCFGKETSNEIGKAGDDNQIRIAGNATSSNQNIKQSTNDEKGSPPKGNLKVSHLSRAIPSLSSGCDSIQICSGNAIAFSQQQMRDIERIATRLTEELKSMKDIVEDGLCSQTSPNMSSKYGADEVRTVIANAKKAEESTRKWLTMMSKDCKRFCKIMSLTKKDSASGNAVHKKRKITFADEAGGKLCHVLIFDDNMASPLESSSDKPELLATQL